MSSQSSDQLKNRTFGQDLWPHKTIDIGANGVTVSANPLGQIYQISAPLAAANKFGIMVAAPWPQFDHSQRTNPKYVREFRKIPERLLSQLRSGLGIDFGGRKGPVVTRHVRDSMGSHAQFEYRIHDSDSFVQTALKVRNDGTVIHASKISNMSSEEQTISVSLDVAFAVSRAGYGQLTDRGAVDMPDASNALNSIRGHNGAGVLSVENRSLGGRVIVSVLFYNTTTGQYIDVNELPFVQRGVQQNPPHRPTERASQLIRIKPWETMKLIVLFHPEDISASDEFAGGDRADETAPDTLFTYQDGNSDPKILVQRHIQDLSGFNRDPAETIESTILWANVNYILGCCSVPISSSQGHGTCCIADHFALNLGWPRDNYWQLKLLRQLSSSKLEKLLPNNHERARQYDEEIRQILTNHLFWLFQMAVTEIEIDGKVRHFWRRSYLVNGLPKDGEVFQLDTQCYPFLEFCEYFETYGNDSFIKFILQSGSFRNILQDLLSRRDNVTNLFLSDETPADDELGDYKFHLSSNILLWHTLRKLARLLSCPQFRPVARAAVNGNNHPWEALNNFAAMIKEGVLRNFKSCRDITHGDVGQRRADQDILAYGFDPSKKLDDPMRYRHYHDGNDMPTLYAQEWGFLKGDDGDTCDDADLRSLWGNTLVWAFTPGPASSGFNSGYQGKGSEPFHGLGSDHSPGPWTLGFFQEWRFAQMVGDEARERKAWKQIEGSAQFDGTFSEAVDITTGVCTSKTWFSWPGAMIAENLIDTVIDQVQKRAS
ncbi:hypothetical protein N8I77_011801 [Diaporthe amygdali]|uniref:Uncharacterized protein n=1 Tax=Phomopsis amygdali TaxID=1214568 RepID=A0AAD9W017_PHOAM|nr:hypothetical protein N8I77_011801 [Diaporthe amygdali]